MKRRCTPTLRRVVPFVFLALAASVSVASQSPLRSSGIRELPNRHSINESQTTKVAGQAGNADVLQVDDGSYEAAFGIVPEDFSYGNQAVYINRFTIDPSALPFTIDTVSILFPVTSQGATTGLHAMQSFDVLIYVDPLGTGNPADAQFLLRKPFLLRPSNTVFQDIQLDLPVVIFSGDVWIGFTNVVTSIDNLPIFPAAVDTTGPNPLRSWIFFNGSIGSHFGGGGPLTAADQQVNFTVGNLLIRARGQAGGLTCVTWSPPASRTEGADNPPPVDSHVCDDVPQPVSEKMYAPRGTLTGYNVYRSDQPGVQPSPQTLFTSVPPTQTQVGSSVSPGGSFFVVTATYDTGESGPSNEVAVVPPTVTKVKVTNVKITVNGSNFSADVKVFVDGVPFVNPPQLKKNGARVVQKGALLTGELIGAYLASHGNHARIDIRNGAGAIKAVDFTR